MSELDFLSRAFGFGAQAADEEGVVATRDTLQRMNSAFRILTDAMPQMVWSTLPDGFHDYYNARWYEFTGVPQGSTDGEGWNGMFHPDDQEHSRRVWQHALETGDQYEVTYRLRHHSGEYRWTLGRALPLKNEQGKIVRWIGTCTDIHESKMMMEENEVLSRELSHRIKNIFAVINGLIGMSARQNPQLRPMAAELQDRIAALGRAHEFARPHSEQSRPIAVASTLHGLLGEILSAYPALGAGRLTMTGDNPEIDDRSATPVALVFHELATNSAKYGALSSDLGTVAIEIAQNGNDVLIDWIEQKGPALQGEPNETGFGTRLVQLAVTQQLAGAIERHWLAEGLRVDMRISASRLKRAEGAPV
ncbi:PAS domain-containing protein [Blastomonas sp. AAP53]|uniref:sensor histidine kinase n=1 Tax=Blastomonas sp. AAP53 TaxID=1248760 RepID=UPI0003123836|nr:PAS domain-containing protein [Blastomonas sp. AAP53]